MILGLIFVSKTENSNRATRFNPNVMYFLSFKKIGEEVHYFGVKSGNCIYNSKIKLEVHDFGVVFQENNPKIMNFLHITL